MYACDRCGKGAQVGMNVSHSHVRTKKRSLPNLHKTTLTFGELRKTMWLCTKCLRIVKKEAIINPKKSEKDSKIENKVEVEKVEVKQQESHTLSEDILKAATKKEPAKAK